MKISPNLFNRAKIKERDKNYSAQKCLPLMTLSARLQRKTLSLSEKIKLLNYKKSNPMSGCRDIAEIFNIGKTSAATIMKNEEKFRKYYANFEGNRKKIRQRKFHKLNKAMYLWYAKCCAANLYPTGALIQEEALLMKEKMT